MNPPPLPPTPPDAGPAFPAVMLLFAIIPAILILAGMVLGYRALHDIRVANGSLGGAVLATFAAGLFPAMFILFACGAGLTLLGQELTPAGRPRSDIWLIAGCGIGAWLSFLMLRAMHREATGWTPPDTTTAAPARSGLATTALVLTIVGGALTLFMLLLPNSPYVYGWRYQLTHFVMLDLAVLLGGFTCGVLARRESAGKTCAWVSGSLFVVLLLIVAG